MSFFHDWRLNCRAEKLLAKEFGFNRPMSQIVRKQKRQCFESGLEAGGNEYDMVIGFVVASLHTWLTAMPDDEELTFQGYGRTMYLIYLIEKNLARTNVLKYWEKLRVALDQIGQISQGGPAPTEPEAAL
jgi:hypothetical protein